jgi:hypothetical protein
VVVAPDAGGEQMRRDPGVMLAVGCVHAVERTVVSPDPASW